jgi:hypothetical protein
MRLASNGVGRPVKNAVAMATLISNSNIQTTLSSKKKEDNKQ